MVIIETHRLLLRHPVADDLEALLAIYQDPEVMRFIPDAPRTREATQAELAWFQHGHPRHPELGLWSTIEKTSGQYIGRCGLLPWSIDGQAEVEVAYLLAKAYWHQGLATEAAQAILDYAVNHLKLSRLVCLIETGHHASIRVAKKIGMRFEREARDEVGPFLLYSRG